MRAPLGNAVLQVVALSGAFLFVGGFLAVVLARRFGRELRQATRAEPRLAASLLREADELGRSVAEAAAARDRATAGLAASEQRFRALAETGALVVWRSDAEGAPLESRGWRALTGQSREEIDGKGWLAAVHPEDRAAAAAAWTGARAAGRPAATEFRVRSGADGGGWRWVRARGVPVARRAGGRIAEWIGVIEDVHGRREAEKAPAGREGRLRLALEAANIATWEYDLARNEGARLGWPGEAILSPGGEGLPLEGWLGQVHPEDRATLQAAFLGMEDGSQTRFVAEFRVRRRAPAEGWAWVSSAGAVVERDPATGAPLRIAGVSSDITERREAEARRLLVAREVDHRAKNLLAVVQSVLRLTPRDEPEEFAVSVERRIAALARAHSLLAERGWSAAGLDAVAAREFASLPPGAAEMAGPPAALVGSAVQPVAMALHELATNSTKHGALSRPEGRVALRWELDRSTGTLRLFWTESGGPPVSAPPSRRGFGSRMIEATVQGQLGGSLAFDWQEDGLRVEIALPAARVLAAEDRSRNGKGAVRLRGGGPVGAGPAADAMRGGLPALLSRCLAILRSYHPAKLLTRMVLVVAARLLAGRVQLLCLPHPTTPSGTVGYGKVLPALERFRALAGRGLAEDEAHAIGQPHPIPLRLGIGSAARENQAAAMQLPLDARLLRRREFHPEPSHPGVLPHQEAGAGFRIGFRPRERIRARFRGADRGRKRGAIPGRRVVRRVRYRLHGADEDGLRGAVRRRPVIPGRHDGRHGDDRPWTGGRFKELVEEDHAIHRLAAREDRSEQQERCDAASPDRLGSRDACGHPVPCHAPW